VRIRWEIRADIHQAFPTLGCAVVCRRRLKKLVRIRVLGELAQPIRASYGSWAGLHADGML